MSKLPIYGASRDIKTTRKIVLEEISRLPLYRVSRDVNTTPIRGCKRYQDYLYTGLQEISRLPVYSA